MTRLARALPLDEGLLALGHAQLLEAVELLLDRIALAQCLCNTLIHILLILRAQLAQLRFHLVRRLRSRVGREGGSLTDALELAGRVALGGLAAAVFWRAAATRSLNPKRHKCTTRARVYHVHYTMATKAAAKRVRSMADSSARRPLRWRRTPRRCATRVRAKTISLSGTLLSAAPRTRRSMEASIGASCSSRATTHSSHRASSANEGESRCRRRVDASSRTRKFALYVRPADAVHERLPPRLVESCMVSCKHVRIC